MMLILPIAILSASLFGGFSVDCETLKSLLVVDGINYRPEFVKLNALLETEVGSDDVKANMEFALKDLYERGSQSNERDASFLEAYRLFTKLSAFGPNVECNDDNFNTLIQNYRAVGMRARTINPSRDATKQANQRIELIFTKYATMYSRKCQVIYPDLLRQKLKLIGAKQTVLINQLTAFVLKDYKIHDDSTEMFRLAGSSGKLMPKLRDEKFIFEALKNQVMLNSVYEYVYLKPLRDYSSGVDSLDEKEFEKLFKDYLISPCRDFMSVLAPVFKPSSFLAIWQHEVMTSELNYYRKWLSYNICYILVENETKTFSAARSFASKLSRENSLDKQSS